jgi:hypothetical protein
MDDAEDELSDDDASMVWFIGGGIVYAVLLITLGLMTIRNGHALMFVIGLVLPFFWLIGAIVPGGRRR